MSIPLFIGALNTASNQLQQFTASAINARVTVEQAATAIDKATTQARRKLDSAAAAFEKQQQQYIEDILAMHEDAAGSFYGYTADAMQQYLDLLVMISQNPDLGKSYWVQESLRKAEDWIKKWGGKAGSSLDFNSLRRRYQQGSGTSGSSAASPSASGSSGGYATGTTVGALK